MLSTTFKRQLHLDMLFEMLNHESIRLLSRQHKYARADIICAFFPDLPCSNVKNENKSKADAVIEELPAENRTFCAACCRIDEVYKNYLNYFFTAQRDKSTFCRNLFLSLFAGKADPLVFMAEKAEKILKRSGFINLSSEDTRLRNLINTLGNAMEALADCLPNFSLPKEIFFRDIRESLPMGLAKVIASYAIYLDVSSFKNDRKRLEMQKQLMDLLYVIWKIQPEDIAWQSNIASGIQAFCAGDFLQAQKLFEEAEKLLHEEDRRSNYSTASYADLLSYQAHMLMDGSCGERSYSKAYQLIQAACRIRALNGDEIFAPRRFYESAFYQLFYPNEWLQHGGSDPATGFLPALQRAANEECAEAIVLLADLLLTGANGCAHLKDCRKGIKLLEHGAALAGASKQERAKCELKLAEYYSQSLTAQQADIHYEKAARLGSYHAIVHLREKNFKPETAFKVCIPLQANRRICFFNSPVCEKDMNAVLRMSLGQEWQQYNGDACSAIQTNPEFLHYKQIVFAFLSNDEQKNLFDALEILKLLNSAAYQQEENARFALIDRVDIFVVTRDPASRMMIDAAMNHLAKDVFFRIRICDPEMMAANELLLCYPTFLPCIDENGEIKEEKWKHQKKHERCQRRIVLLGTSRYVKAIVLQIIASTFLEEYPTQLAIVGPEANHMKVALQEECPGVFAAGSASHITPQFVCCNLDALPVNRTGEEAEEELRALLHSANYFVVADDDDMNNMALAVRLRTGLIKAHMPQGLQPVIAVLYKDNRTQWIASQIAVGARNIYERYHWTENYGLCLFGSTDAFRLEALLGDPVQRCAIDVHKSYYGLDGDAEKERAALSDYYRRSYNRDSSMCLVIGMIYHCFGMGVFHNQSEDYACEMGIAALGHRYRLTLCDDQTQMTERIEKAARIEHSRWNGWCMSRGWTKPDDYALVVYMQMQNPRHHLEIGKLHPYITGYDQLVQECAKLNKLITAYQHTKRCLPDPRISDRELAQKIPYFLSLFSCDKPSH